jgi:hypothetical protein
MLDRLIDNLMPLIYLIFFFPVPLYFIKLLRQMKNPSSFQSEIIRATQENTGVVRENSHLLRELISLNRQLLEKQNQADS